MEASRLNNLPAFWPAPSDADESSRRKERTEENTREPRLMFGLNLSARRMVPDRVDEETRRQRFICRTLDVLAPVGRGAGLEDALDKPTSRSDTANNAAGFLLDAGPQLRRHEVA